MDLGALANVPLLMWPRERSPEYYDTLIDMCRERGLEPIVTIGTTRISGSWSYFLNDARAFALATSDFAEQQARDPLVSVRIDPPGYIPIEAVWRDTPTGDVATVLNILGALTAGRR